MYSIIKYGSALVVYMYSIIKYGLALVVYMYSIIKWAELGNFFQPLEIWFLL